MIFTKDPLRKLYLVFCLLYVLHNLWFSLGLIIILLFLCLVFLVLITNSSPKSYPNRNFISICPNTSIVSVTWSLEHPSLIPLIWTSCLLHSYHHRSESQFEDSVCCLLLDFMSVSFLDYLLVCPSFSNFLRRMYLNDLFTLFALFASRP